MTTVADILRPLAECTVRRTVVVGTLEALPKTAGALLDVLPLEEQEVLDPRFDVLRRPINPDDWVRGMPGRGTVEVNGKAWELDASLGAIVRAVAACGLVLTYLSLDHARLESLTYRKGAFAWTPSWVGDGDTPEEATARALVVAWRDEKVASLKSEESQPW